MVRYPTAPLFSCLLASRTRQPEPGDAQRRSDCEQSATVACPEKLADVGSRSGFSCARMMRMLRFCSAAGGNWLHAWRIVQLLSRSAPHLFSIVHLLARRAEAHPHLPRPSCHHTLVAIPIGLAHAACLCWALYGRHGFACRSSTSAARHCCFVLHGGADGLVLCFCSLLRRPSGSSRSWPRRPSRTAPSRNGSASGQTTRSGANLGSWFGRQQHSAPVSW